MSGEYLMDINVPRSGAAQFTLLFRDINDDPVDCTGCTVAIEFRYAAGDPSTIATATSQADDNVTGLVWTDIATGQALVTIYGSIFSALDGDYEVVPLSYKIRLTKAGDPPVLVFGTLNLLAE
ncbi:hypothetical protein WG907_04310 [Sphingobium sp. AN558]|uniref:hypothetical protein n=1 Tax=Sphingobium sp. AN558 TaxID=3133442 RepID=UPI0030C0559A